MSAYLNSLVKRELQGMGSVLDLGCGSDSRIRFVPGVRRKVGVDAFQPSIDKAKAKGIHDEYLTMPLDQLDLPDKSFDAVMAIDLLEHFEKEESRALLATMERLARTTAVLFTPNGFLPQPALDGNPWQEHRCGWDSVELKARGYRVEGVLGFKWMRGEGHFSVFRPGPIGDLVANFSRRVWTHRRPQLDAALFAVKRMESELAC